MAEIKNYNLDLLNKIAAAYEEMDEKRPGLNVTGNKRLGLQAKEGVSDETLAEARAALNEVIPNGLIFNLNKSVEPRHSERRQELKDLIDALNELEEEKQAPQTKQDTINATVNNPGPMERLANLIGDDYYKYNFKFENGRIVSDDAPQDVMIGVYARLREQGLGVTYDVNEDGNISVRGLRHGEKPATLTPTPAPSVAETGIQLINDVTKNYDYQDFINKEKNPQTPPTNDKGKVEETKADENATDKDALQRLNERFNSAEGRERLMSLAEQLNMMFDIKNGCLMSKEELSDEEFEFANTSLEYFYPTETVVDNAGKIIGITPVPGYEELANTVYDTMRKVAEVKKFEDDISKKKAAEVARFHRDPINFAEYVNDYLSEKYSDDSDDNEILYNALLFATLQAVKPADNRQKYSDYVSDNKSVYDIREEIQNEINALPADAKAAYDEAANEARQAFIDSLPPKALVEFENNLTQQLAQDNVTAEQSEDLTAKLSFVHARMDEIINDIADGSINYGSDESLNFFAIGEDYEGITSVINSRLTFNENAQAAQNIINKAIEEYDETYNLTDLNEQDAEILLNRSLQVDDLYGKMGLTQFLGRKLKNVVSSEKVSTERNLRLAPYIVDLYKNLTFTDENGEVIPQLDENGDFLQDSLYYKMADVAMARAYIQTVLSKKDIQRDGKANQDETITLQSLQQNIENFMYGDVLALVTTEMVAKGEDSSKAKELLDSIAAGNTYQLPAAPTVGMIATNIKSTIGVLDRLGTKIGRDAPVLSAMYGQIDHLDKGMKNSRFKKEYQLSKKLSNTKGRTLKMLSKVALTAVAFHFGGAPLVAGIVASMASISMYAGYVRHKRQAEKDGIQPLSGWDYLRENKTQLAMTVTSIGAIMTGAVWVSYSMAGVNILNQMVHNVRRDKIERLKPYQMVQNVRRDKDNGRKLSFKNLMGTAVEAGFPSALAVVTSMGIGGLLTHLDDSNSISMDNLFHDVSDAMSGIKNIFGFGNTVAEITPETQVVDNSAAQTATTAEVPNTAGSIQTPNSDLENQVPPKDATYVQSPADYAAEVAARQAAQVVNDTTTSALGVDTTTVQNNTGDTAANTAANAQPDTTDGTTETPSDTSAGTAGTTTDATAGTTGVNTTATTDGSDTKAQASGENIPDAQAFNHTYDQAAHDHAGARIHGQGTEYKLDYNDNQLNNALDQIRTIGGNNPHIQGADGQVNSEILMYKLNQMHQLLAPDTDIVTPDGTRVEAQAYYGHQMPDGSHYGPHDLRADLLGGKAVDPQAAAEIFAKIEPHIDANGHHIGDIHNFKEAGTWSYRQTGDGGYTQDLVHPATPQNDGIVGHLDENYQDALAGKNTVSEVGEQGQNDSQDTPAPTTNGVEQKTADGAPIPPVTGLEQNAPEGNVENNKPTETPFVPYIPYDKPIPSKFRHVLRNRMGSLLGSVKKTLGIKDKSTGQGTDAKVDNASSTNDIAQPTTKRPISYMRHDSIDNKVLDNEASKTGTKTAGQTPVGNHQREGVHTPPQGTNGAVLDEKRTPVPSGVNKKLVVTESDLPKDPYFNISSLSENVERDVNGAWVADFRENAPKINRTVKTANADYVTGKLPNAPQKGEIEPTVIPMGMTPTSANKDLLDNREELPEPRKELPHTVERDRRAIRLGAEQNNPTIHIGTEEQKTAMKLDMFKGGIPKHIRGVLEEKAQQAKQPPLVLENKEDRAKLTPEQAKALLDKYRDVTKAVEGMKQAPVTQNTTGTDTNVTVRSSKGNIQKPQPTQTGANGNTVDTQAAVWKHVTQKKNKQP